MPTFRFEVVASVKNDGFERLLLGPARPSRALGSMPMPVTRNYPHYSADGRRGVIVEETEARTESG